MTTDRYRLPMLLETTKAGRRPAWSEPRVGLKSTIYTSPRFGYWGNGPGATDIIRPREPVVALKRRQEWCNCS